MTAMTEEKVVELKTAIEAGEIEEIKRMNYRLSDAVREGSTVTEHQQNGWGDGRNACALHAGIIAAKARGYMK